MVHQIHLPNYDYHCGSDESLPNAPQAGQWFDAFFVMLAQNAQIKHHHHILRKLMCLNNKSFSTFLINTLFLCNLCHLIQFYTFLILYFLIIIH